MSTTVNRFVKVGYWLCPWLSFSLRMVCAHPVVSPDDLAKQAIAVSRVRLARSDRDRAQAQLRVEIVNAYRMGAAVKDIAAAADVSRQWVWRVVNDAQSGPESGGDGVS